VGALVPAVAKLWRAGSLARRSVSEGGCHKKEGGHEGRPYDDGALDKLARCNRAEIFVRRISDLCLPATG